MNNLSSIWIKLVLVVILVWFGAFLYYIQEISTHDKTISHTADGIVILTGTPARLKLGFELLKSGAAQRLLISGVNSHVSRAELQKAMGESDAVMSCCVDLGRLARDTVGNAYEASLWASENKFSTLLVVTSAYHMPRSLVELKRQMPHKNLQAVSPQADAVELEKWWTKPTLMYVLTAEFNKYVISLFRARLEYLAMDGASK